MTASTPRSASASAATGMSSTPGTQCTSGSSMPCSASTSTAPRSSRREISWLERATTIARFSASCSLNGRPARSGARAYLLEAVLAVDGPSLSGEERHLGVGAADGAFHGVHGPGAGHGAALAAEGAALGAAPGLVHQGLHLIELLLARRKGEFDSAVATGQGFVGEAHPGTSFRSLLRLEIGSLAGVPAAWWLADPREERSRV